MRNPLGNKTYNPPLFTGLLVFLLVFAITTFVTYQRYLIQKSSEKDEIRRQAERVDNEMKSVLEQGFSSTQSIAFLVENYGVPEDFTKISQLILKTNSNVDALELVDGAGVITHVYPLEGNEVLGFNILRDSIGKPGAIKTIEKGEYFITGPIDLKQGGSGFVCRTPIYNDKEFAGFAAAVIKLSSLLSKIPMDTLDNGDFSYQLSKVNPDGSEEMFLSPQKKLPENALKHTISDYNGEWKLYVISNKKNALYGLFVMGILGLFLAGLAGFFTYFIMKQPKKLQKMVNEKTLLLKESEQKFRTLIEQASDGIFLADFKGNVLDANLAGVKMFRYSKEEFLEKNLRDLATKEDLNKTPIRFSEIKQGEAVLTERKLLKRNGSSFYGEVSAKKLNDGNILGIVRDVTARKKLELAAWDNLQKFEKAFNSRTIGMAIFDEELRFVDVNPYFLEKIGYSLQEVKGKTFEELGPIIIEERLKRKEALKRLNEHGKVLSMELIVQPNGKEKIHFSTSAESYVVDNKNYILATYLDRTEEKKAQEKIISSEKKYRELTERISDAFVAFDKNWDFTYVNNKASKIIGRDSIGLVGKNLWEEFPQFAQTEAYDTFKSALENQKYVQFEQFHKPYDVWIENHIYPSPEGLTIYFRDITKKKVAEQENRKLLTVVENSPGFIGLSSMDSNSIYLNQYGRKLVGLPPEGSISDISWFDFFPENTVELIKEEYLPIVLKEGTWSGEAYLKNFETNTFVPTAFSAFTINDKVSKEPIGIGSVAFDLTERKKVEREILDLQSKMNAAIRIGKIGYWDWHIESGIIDWSERMYEIYDVELGREINVAFTKTLVHPEDLEMHDKTIEHKTKNRDDSSFTYRIVDRNENIKHVLVQMEVKVDLDGNPINYQGTAIDITQEKEAEVLLERQNQELKKTNSELDSFVYSASHELRAPLASLLGLVNIMKKEERSDESLLNLRMMENSITRLDEFIGDIVQYSRNKHIEVVPEKINFSALISRSLEDFWYLENTQKIKVIKNIEEGVPFFSDNKRVMVLLNNFISNAIKYHDMEKPSPSIWINIKTNQKEAIIRIKDNGTGIAKENQDKIYNMFYRTTSKVTGSGIGLFIVKEILDRLKGTVSLESTLNKGSVFTIKLPNLSPGD